MLSCITENKSVVFIDLASFKIVNEIKNLSSKNLVKIKSFPEFKSYFCIIADDYEGLYCIHKDDYQVREM